MSFVARCSNPFRLALLLAVVWGAGGLRPEGAHAQLSPAFTYQGQLQQSGIPENATCDFQFGLFAAASGGTALGTQAVPSVSVTNGLFTVVLNASSQLGVNAFSGSTRYLEVDVCCPTGCAPSYVTLSPRQQLTATPYALYAPAAGSASNLSCSGCVSSADLDAGAVTSSAIASGTIQQSNLGFTPVLSVGATGPLASSGGQNPTLSLTGTVSVANGGTGASTADGARGNLGAAMSGANADITSLSGITGNITLPESTSATAGNILKGGNPFIHDYPGSSYRNTFVGEGAGNFSLSGNYNTALGQNALQANTDGSYNTAVGVEALVKNTGNATCTGPTVPLMCCNGAGTGYCGSSNTAVGQGALLSNTTGAFNTAVGQATLGTNTIGYGNTATGGGALGDNFDGGYNTAVGINALVKNTGNATCTGAGAPLSCCSGAGTGSCGSSNTAVGGEALYSNKTGTNNTAVGADALSCNTGGSGLNTAVGGAALDAWASGCNDTGTANTAVGAYALSVNSGGSNNTGVGENALGANSSGGSNTAVGWDALVSLTAGTGNIALGNASGSSLTGTESHNIDIGSSGTAGESFAIHIGTPYHCTQYVTSPLPPYHICIAFAGQSQAFIAGIYESSVTDQAVYVNSSGQLGTLSSSARFKEDIQDMGESTDGILKLRPVRFRYKRDIDPSGLEQYGLVAEEVAKVYPDLVSNDAEGRPYTVRYQFLAPMLLNEVQKQARRIAQLTEQTQQATEQKRQISEQSRQLSDQAQQIAALRKQVEELVTLKAETAALQARLDALDTPQTVANRRSRHAQDARPAAF